MKYFFSCDWGTSSFRLRLADAQNAKVLSAIKTGYGIANAFGSWKLANREEKDRIIFYQSHLFEQVKNISAGFSISLEHVPIIISGMASSSIGMLELPYKELPFEADGSDLVIQSLSCVDQHKVIMISGVRSSIDVLRGEETILSGCNMLKNDMQQLFIFPGTHSKHIATKHGLAQTITTYMTGELFDLLSKKSILANSVKRDDALPGINSYFTEGVSKGSTLNLLNSIFHVRTNQLFKRLTPGENYYYLSGLLIGYELKELIGTRSPITLVCSGDLGDQYMQALAVLGLKGQVRYQNADEALIRGQWRILQRILNAEI